MSGSAGGQGFTPLFSGSGSGGGGATVLVVTSEDSTVVQNGGSTYDSGTSTLSVDLSAVGGGGGGVTPAEIQQQTYTFVNDTGGTNAFVVAGDPTITSLTNGLGLMMYANNSNSNATPTITVDANSPVPIIGIDLDPIVPGTIAPGVICLLVYSTNAGAFILFNSLYGTLQEAINIAYNRWIYSSDDGTADAYNATSFPGNYVPLLSAQQIIILVGNTNLTTSPTLSVNGINPYPILLTNGNNVQAGDIVGLTLAIFILNAYNTGAPYWQLLNPVISGISSVTPQNIQQQTFVYDGTATNILDNYSVTISPAPASLVQGMRISFKVPATNTTTSPGLNLNSLGLGSIVNNSNSAINIGDMVINCNAEFSLNTNGNWQLINPASAASVTPQDIQQLSFSKSLDTGTADAYVGTYTPTPASSGGYPIDGEILELFIANANETTFPTFDCGDGNGPQYIVLNGGFSLVPGDLPANYWASFTWNNYQGEWQLNNPAISVGGVVAAAYLQVWQTTTVSPITGSGVSFAFYPIIMNANGTPININYNSGSGVATVIVPGTYVISVGAAGYTGTNKGLVTIMYNSRFTPAASSVVPVGAGNAPGTVSVELKLAEGDQIWPAIGVDSGDTFTFYGNLSSGEDFNTYFTMMLSGVTSQEEIANPRLLVSIGLSGTQTVGTSTTTPIQFNTVIVDNLSTFNTSTYTWTAPYTDWFEICQATTINSGASISNPIVSLKKNGTTVVKNGYVNLSGGSAPTLSGLFQANAGDTFQILFQNLDPTNTMAIAPGQPSTYWDILSVSASFFAPLSSGTTVYATTTVTAAALASGGQVNIQVASSGTAQYRVVAAYTNVANCTNFDSGGNRQLNFTDGTNTFGYIYDFASGGLAQVALYPFLFVNPNITAIGIQLPQSNNVTIPSQAGSNIYATYTGGSNDYISGQIEITLVLTQVAT